MRSLNNFNVEAINRLIQEGREVHLVTMHESKKVYDTIRDMGYLMCRVSPDKQKIVTQMFLPHLGDCLIMTE
jgi:hypothetical protein